MAGLYAAKNNKSGVLWYTRNCLKKVLSVLMYRRSHDLAGLSLFHQLSVPHDCNTVCQMWNNREVMGYEQIR